ncbi:MAG TPA: type VI secretion system protein TssA, partial [Pyrinomonadaceae bacterium]|nr:type VI secretion system protein TssA [Pyrinomonadaceae bacterium]
MSAAAMPEQLDLEKLLSPINAERPAGDYLRYEGTYDRVREARREDDASLSQGIYKTELKRADWSTAANICLQALQTRTKDVQLAAWLLEAWLRLHGFAGCRDGMLLLRELMERFWEHLHPQLDEGDPEDRVHTFVWINEKLSTQLKLIPLTAPQAGDLAPYSFADWESACRLEQLAERDPKQLRDAEAQNQVTLARFQSSAMLTSTQFFMELADELSGAAEGCLALDELLEEKFGPRSPGLERF